MAKCLACAIPSPILHLCPDRPPLLRFSRLYIFLTIKLGCQQVPFHFSIHHPHYIQQLPMSAHFLITKVLQAFVPKAQLPIVITQYMKNKVKLKDINMTLYSKTVMPNFFHPQKLGHSSQSPLFAEFQPIHDPLEFSTNRPQSVSSSNNTTSSRSVRRAVPAARHMISTSNTTHFREHLNSALDHLRSPSPLVPGLEDIGQDTSLLQSSHVNNRISRALPNPPTLPPIVTDTDNDNWDQNSPLLDILTSQASAGSPRDTSSFTSPTTNFDSRASVSSSVSNIGLGDHPLPSPGLDDLHNWMNSSSSGSGSSHSWDISQIPAASDTADSRQESSNVVNYQGTSSSSSAGQSRADHTASTQHRASSSPIGPRPPVATSLPLRNRWFMRMSDLEGNRPSASTSTSTSISTSQSDPDSQSNLNSSSIGLYSFSLNRRSVDENAVRSLDQGFDSRLSFCK